MSTGLFLTFIAGVVSFFSPCVLPLVPGYLGFVSGLSFNAMKQNVPQQRRAVFIATLLFVAGFLLVFIILGAAASSLGTFLLQHRSVFEKIGGIVLVIFGIQLTGVVKIPQLQREWRLPWKKLPAYHLRGFLAGIFFAFGWSPCIGPILGTILVTASLKETVWQGALQLFIYGLGIALPFLIVAVLLAQLPKWMMRLQRTVHILQIVAGCLVILFGIFLFFGQVRFITAQLFSLYQSLNLQFLVQ